MEIYNPTNRQQNLLNLANDLGYIYSWTVKVDATLPETNTVRVSFVSGFSKDVLDHGLEGALKRTREVESVLGQNLDEETVKSIVSLLG